MAGYAGNRFTASKKGFKKAVNIRYLIAGLLAAAVAVNIFGLYPAITLNIPVYILLYILLASIVFIYYRHYRGRARYLKGAVFYAVFILFLTISGMTGGVLSPLKWAVYTIILAVAASGGRGHSAVMLCILFLNALKQLGEFTPQEMFFFPAAALYIGALFAAEAASAKKEKPQPEEGAAEEQEPGDFAEIVYSLLEKLLGIYRQLLGANSVVLFTRDSLREEEYALMLGCSGSGSLTRALKVREKEGVLGAAFARKSFFLFDTGGAKMPYYIDSVEARAAAVMPVIGARITGFIVIDYTDEAPGAQEEIKAKLSAMSGDIRDILRLFEINRKVMNREKRVSTLYDIYGKLNMLEGRESLMKSFFREVRAFDISGGYLAEYIPGERAFEVSESFNYPENIRGRKFSVKEDEIVRSVYEKSGAAVVDSAAPSGISLNFRRSDIGSFFISVLRDKGSVYGFVKLDKEKGGGFGGFEVRTLEMIMSRITILLENAALYDKIKKQATTDGLTGLCNHLTFQEKLAVMIERQGKEGGQGVSLCLIDIDYFKKFNDTFGHQEGDRVLQKTALMLKSFEKKHEGSLAARYGGEEFVFVMQGANLRAAAAAAEEIRAYAGKNISGGNGKEQRRITLSIGVASLPETAKSQRELIKNADEMLYAAKEQGRDRVVWREG